MSTTDDNTTDSAATGTAHPVTDDAEVQEGQQEPAVEDRPGAEAARYRRRLRETETERDALAGRVEAMQRAEAVRLAGEALAEGGDLFALTDTAVEDLLGEDGAVDPEKVAAAAKALVAARGDRFARTKPHFGGGVRTPLDGGAGDTTWAGALRAR